MKKFRKIMAVLVAAIMVVAMTVPAFAEPKPAEGRMTDEKGKITITNPDPNETYTAYKILDLASFKDTDVTIPDDTYGYHAGDAYAYVISENSPWLSFIQAQTDYFEPIVTTGAGTLTPKIQIKNATGYYYVVTPTSAFQNGFTDAHDKDETGNREWTHTNSQVQKLAQAAYTFAQTHKDDESIATKVVATASEDDTTKTSNLDLYVLPKAETPSYDLPLGYYLVNSTTGTLCALDTTNKNAEIIEKNIAPSATKEVQEDSLDTNTSVAGEVTGFVSQNDANIGEKVYYRSLVTVRKGAEKYVLYDVMDQGLTFNNDVKVYLLDGTATATYDDKTKWGNELGTAKITLTPDPATDMGSSSYPAGASFDKPNFYSVRTEKTGENRLEDTNNTFEIHFVQDFLKFLSDEMNATTSKEYKLMVTFSATLNSKAAVDKLNDNHNVIKLKYGETGTFTEPVTVSTATWSVDLFKFTNRKEEGATNPTPLDKAQFKIWNADKSKALKFVVEDEANCIYRYDDRVQSVDTTTENSTAAATDADEITYGNTSSPLDGAATNSKVVDTLTTKSGVVVIKGLDGDSYFVEEILAPLGYNQLKGMVPFHIVSNYEAEQANLETAGAASIYANNALIKNAGYVASSAAGLNHPADHKYSTLAGNVTIGETSMAKKVGIENTTTTELPSTGGMGTTVLYIVGGMLVILAGAYLFFSRKKTA